MSTHENSFIPLPVRNDSESGVFMLPFERGFNTSVTTRFFKDYWHITTFLISAIYLIVIRLGEKVMVGVPYKLELKPLLFLWNAFFALFSLVGSARMLPELYSSWLNHGFVYTVCNPSFALTEITGCWTELFAWSKVLELGDTVLLVLRRRPVIFLHWYHHVTVLVYTWHASKDHTAAGRWFVSMNYTIHALMYSYYAIRTLGFNKFPKIVPISITSMQLGQMIAGCYIGWTVYRTKVAGGYCNQTYENLGLCLFMYFTYAVLFGNYFYCAYISKKPKKLPASAVNGFAKEGVKNGKIPEQNGSVANGHYSNGIGQKNGAVMNGKKVN